MRMITRILQSRNIQPSQVLRSFSTFSRLPGTGNKSNSNSVEYADDFERRILGDNTGNEENSSSFFQKLDRVEKAYNSSGLSSKFNPGNRSEHFDGFDYSINTLADGINGKLKEAAKYFEVDPDEIDKDGYSFRPDVDHQLGVTYDIKDLDLKKAGVQKPFKRYEFETTTAEVLQKADFRNVRFLANFITEGGIIIKRSKTRISAKAQRKVARAIKTARAFGLMPFTTMGTKQFVFGRTMENLDKDYEFQTYHPQSFVDEEAS
ncbi:hypothetical protein ACH5RR_020646 [Cinchona calisaya]|uniref:Small ribosomal subunit protein bS18c n=1 Tax=Cinchona calisaya TaxID=153742 RepID=A0ABD2ZIW6_9GENT